MKGYALSLLIGFLFICIGLTTVFAETNKSILFFYGVGCPHCSQIERYFEENELYDRYHIEKKEIYFNKDNALQFNNILDELKVPLDNRGIPLVVIGNKILMGDKLILDNFTNEAENFFSGKQDLDRGRSVSNKSNLTIVAIIIGSIVDSINPCEFAVLIILMTTILATGNSAKALKAGLAFSLSIFISYFLMGLGFYKALSLGGFTEVFFRIVGWLAIVLGLLNLKDFFWYGKGILMEVPLSWRPSMKRLLQSVHDPKGAFLVGFIVSLFLLPCTSGPYIVILGMLAKEILDVRAIFYLIIYNVIFVLPMILISFAVYRGFNTSKAEAIRQKRLRLLHLIAGFIMLLMGISIVMGWI